MHSQDAAGMQPRCPAARATPRPRPRPLHSLVGCCFCWQGLRRCCREFGPQRVDGVHAPLDCLHAPRGAHASSASLLTRHARGADHSWLRTAAAPAGATCPASCSGLCGPAAWARVQPGGRGVACPHLVVALGLRKQLLDVVVGVPPAVHPSAGQGWAARRRGSAVSPLGRGVGGWGRGVCACGVGGGGEAGCVIGTRALHPPGVRARRVSSAPGPHVSSSAGSNVSWNWGAISRSSCTDAMNCCLRGGRGGCGVAGQAGPGCGRRRQRAGGSGRHPHAPPSPGDTHSRSCIRF